MKGIFIISELYPTTSIIKIFGFYELGGWPLWSCPEWSVDPMGLAVTPNAYFSLLTQTKQLLVTFYDVTAGIGASFWTHGWRTAENGGQRKDRQTWKLK